MIHARFQKSSYIVCCKSIQDVEHLCSNTYYLSNKTLLYNETIDLPKFEKILYYTNHSWSVKDRKQFMNCNIICKNKQYKQDKIQLVKASEFFPKIIYNSNSTIAVRPYGNFFLPIQIFQPNPDEKVKKISSKYCNNYVN